MPPIDRQRKKRTVYLGPDEQAALETVRRKSGMRTKASAMRYAILETERRLTEVEQLAVLRLVRYVESLGLLSPRDEHRLQALCLAARREIGARNHRERG